MSCFPSWADFPPPEYPKVNAETDALVTMGQPQHLEALAKANETRLGAAALRRRFERGEVALAEVLRDGGVGGMRLGYVLGWLHRYGPWRIGRLLKAAEIPPGFLERRVRELTERQRVALGDAVEGNGR